MKPKLLFIFFALLLSRGLLSQTVDYNLVITEARYGFHALNYVELTNMGDDPIDLMPYRLGCIHPWTFVPWGSTEEETIMLGEFIKEYGARLDVDTILDPGESIWISQVDDWTRKQHLKYPEQYPEKVCRDDQWNADIRMHRQEYESLVPSDSVTYGWQMLNSWGGTDTWFLGVFTDTDTLIVDVVGGPFGQPGSSSIERYTIAGIPEASYTHSLVRKFGVKEGHTNFDEGAGTNIDDSEWIPLPPLNDNLENLQERKMFWTVGNQGDYQLTETTLQSDILDVDFANGIIHVPWGVHNEDSVMMCFEYTPGLAWDYQLNTAKEGDANWAQAHADSGFISARTGDMLWIYSCGTELMLKGFHIDLLPPSEDANWIVPKSEIDYETGTWPELPRPKFNVTHGAVPDSILDVPYATRTDTILKYFEKAPNATWEFVFVDGVTRPDVKNGDLLRITTENGDVKDYYIEVANYAPSHNAYLSSITWPDAPDWVKMTRIYGWQGDTLPGFNKNELFYRIRIPWDIEEIPAFVAKTESVNATVEISRPTKLDAPEAYRTYTFTVTAEDDTTVNVYEVVIRREPLDENIQPNIAEPFFSEYVWRDQWANYYLEIMNPGTMPIDMSKYMIMMQWTSDWQTMIGMDNAPDVWQEGRMLKYIPGYRWVDSLTWTSGKARFVTYDFENVNRILQPGGTFVIGHTTRWDQKNAYEQDWVPEQPGVVDVEFAYNVGRTSGGLDYSLTNPWDEKIGGNSAIGNWEGACMFMVKIVGDSILEGLKAATDPQDFEVIEAWGTDGGGNWMIDGENANLANQCVTFRRKPGIDKPNPQVGASFGATPGESEWERYDQRWGVAQGMGWSEQIMHVTENLGQHTMDEVTHYLSTVSSILYQVSPGYSISEEIRGAVTGTTVSGFLSNIIKKDEGQQLVVRRDGNPLAMDDVIAMEDSLIVHSADGENSTHYRLEVTADGLSDDVLLLSDIYTIEVNDPASGSISGILPGTLLAEMLDHISVPGGAALMVTDEEGTPIPMKMLGYDTTYSDVLASDEMLLEVTAENFIDKMVYSVHLDLTTSDIYFTSDLYTVNDVSISNIPSGITVENFLAHIFPSGGATVEIVDKALITRIDGRIAYDDYLEVTSGDGSQKKLYHLTFLDENIRIPIVYPVSDISVCEGDSVRLTATGDFTGSIEIQWDNGVEDNVRFSPVETTEYVLTVTNEMGSSNDTVMVFVQPSPVIDGVTDYVICRGDSITLEASSDGIISWNNYVSNGMKFPPESSGNFIVTAESPEGCISTDTVFVTVNDTYYYPQSVTICDGENMQWQDQSLTETGVYYNQLIAGNGCDSVYEMNLYVAALPENYEITGKTEVEQNEAATYVSPPNMNVTYHFEVENGTIIDNTSNAVTIQWSNAGQGKILSHAENERGCFSDIIILEVTVNPTGIFSKEMSGLHIYPNPFDDVLYITFEREVERCELLIRDIAGKTMLHEQYDHCNQIEPDIGFLDSGLYFIRLNFSGRSKTFKVLKR